MGAEYVEYKIKAKTQTELRKMFEVLQENAAYEHGHSYSGDINMANGLKIENKVFLTYKEAENYLSEKTEKWGSAIAVEVKNEKENYYLIGAVCSS